jgi:hypothetical protein
MFDNDEDGKWIPSKATMENWLQYAIKNEKEDEFPWFYLDYNTLQNAAFANGLKAS